jgi:hypothetical protein
LKSRLETGSHKKFVIPTEDEAVVSSTLENGGKNQNEEEHGIPTLVKSLVNLKVADNSPEDDNDSGSNRSVFIQFC